MYVPRRIPDTLRYMYVLRYVSDVSYYDLCMCHVHVRDERARPPRKVMKVESAACRCEEKASIFCLFVSVLFRFLRYLQFDTIFADVSDVSGGSHVRNLEVLIGLHLRCLRWMYVVGSQCCGSVAHNKCLHGEAV